MAVTKKPLPPAFVAHSKALHDASASAHLKAARDALAQARSALQGAERSLYAVALALRTLDDPKLLAALERADIYEAAELDLHLSRNTVVRLRRAADAVDPERFARLGHTLVNALLSLAEVTEADDTDAILAERTITLWKGGPRFVVKGASTRAVDAAATQVRAHLAEQGAATDARGNRVKPDEVALAAKLTKSLKARAVDATVTAHATKPGASARFSVDGLDADGARALIIALTKAKTPQS